LEDAEAEANRIIEAARDQAEMIANEQEIVRIAMQQAGQVLDEAHEHERETRAGAEEYADTVFGHIENTIDQVSENVRRCRDQLNNRARY